MVVSAVASSSGMKNGVKVSSKNKSSQGNASDFINWVYINGLGERNFDNVTESDILTAITFDKSGEFLAVGDKGGRVITFRY